MTDPTITGSPAHPADAAPTPPAAPDEGNHTGHAATGAQTSSQSATDGDALRRRLAAVRARTAPILRTIRDDRLRAGLAKPRNQREARVFLDAAEARRTGGPQ